MAVHTATPYSKKTGNAAEFTHFKMDYHLYQTKEKQQGRLCIICGRLYLSELLGDCEVGGSILECVSVLSTRALSSTYKTWSGSV